MIIKQSIFEFVWASLWAFFVLGHSFWLIARKQPERIRLEANMGHDFPVSTSAVRPERVGDFRLVSHDESEPVTNLLVEDNSLVAAVETRSAPFYAALSLNPHPIVLEAEKFAGYTAEEQAENFVAPNFVAGQTNAAQRESYSKFAKAFVASDAAQTDQLFNSVIGQQLEIVPQTAFSELRQNRKLTVRVLFENEPVKDLRVSMGCENQNKEIPPVRARTDENGLAAFALPTDGHWFVQTHFIRAHRDRENFEWESFFASLTFKI